MRAACIFSIPLGAWVGKSMLCHELMLVFTTHLGCKRKPPIQLVSNTAGSFTPRMIQAAGESEVGTFRGNLETFTIESRTERTALSLVEFYAMLDDN